MKIKRHLLITGGTGLLGLNWACAMREHFDITLVTHQRKCTLQGVRAIPARLDDKETFSKLLEDLKPSIVLHTVGLASVDLCETQPDLAEKINVKLAENVALATYSSGTQLVHISTDHLFHGDQQNYTEELVPAPLNVYGKTKFLAEQRVAEVNPAALIVRTNFFGWGNLHRKSFSDWIIDSLRAGQTIKAFKDIYYTPILIDRLAKATHKLVNLGARGVVNVVGDERITKFDFAVHLASVFGLPLDLIEPALIDMGSMKAHRPHDMSLCNGKIKALLGGKLGNIDEFLHDLKQQEQAGRHEELKEAVSE